MEGCEPALFSSEALPIPSIKLAPSHHSQSVLYIQAFTAPTPTRSNLLRPWTVFQSRLPGVFRTLGAEWLLVGLRSRMGCTTLPPALRFKRTTLCLRRLQGTSQPRHS